MRPRRVRLGYDFQESGPHTEKEQRFNEAEARAPRILQSVVREIISEIRASMRPRRVRLGYNDLHYAQVNGISVASMRPRRVRLGYHQFSAAILLSYRLQ